MSLKIGDPNEIKAAAQKFAEAAVAPADATAQVAQRLVLSGGQVRSGLDDSTASRLDWIVATLSAGARSRADRAGEIDTATADVVDALVTADEDGAAPIRRATPT